MVIAQRVRASRTLIWLLESLHDNMTRSLVIFCALVGPAFGCECAEWTECELVQRPTIFIGQVIAGGVGSIREDPWYSPSNHVRFRVIETFRGLPKGIEFVDMSVTTLPGMCSPNPYYPGRTYLVVPTELNGKLNDGGCYSGRDIDRSPDLVRYVREYFAGKTPLNVHGRVAVARDGNMVNYLLSIGEAKPLSGVRVWTSRDGKDYSALTDGDGRYSLTVPANGEYEVRAELFPYAFDYAKVHIGEGGCASRNFALHSGSSISGMVWDDKGNAVQNANVALIDLDRKPQGSDSHAWFMQAYTEQPDKSFLFKNVPMGRYLLVFNPDGPRSSEFLAMPFESTYYPHGDSRREARPIEVTRTTAHLVHRDLVTGKPVTFRPVVVRAQFPDGVPMGWAVVRATGEPVGDGDVLWTFSKVTGAGKDSTVRFQAPTNRKLRIEIIDWYGRDLKKAYVATYAAGTEPIAREFVITP